MKGFHYLNTSYSFIDVVMYERGLSPKIPSDIRFQMFIRSLGVRYDTVLPTLESKPKGYVRTRRDDRTDRSYIRQVVHS
ncbi:hypothetical protein NVP1022O_19 [Vibrio phage 1.022.O._10N.286.45.A10]|nr:hypothetical protein NVP1022O_19 [Vibrio phage 1.022.O._10N.286.45.A10]